MNEVYLASKIDTDSLVDGPGLRAVIWFQGCLHDCAGCHNKETHPLKEGTKYKLEEIYEQIDNLEDQDGITFSGGDPFFQPEALLELLKYSKKKKYNNWVYTGYLYEDILKMKDIYQEILKYIDVIVDGKFELDNKSLNYKYRGSSNQRLIDVKKSLNRGKVVLVKE